MFQKNLLSILLIGGLAFFSTLCYAQTITQPLQNFEKIQVSPLIQVVLQEGASENIRIEYEGIGPEKINFLVKGKKLPIYLDDARYTVKTEGVIREGYKQKVPVYRNLTITAYVTYRSLKSIEIRGEESLSCKDSLISDKFKIREFGESRVDLAFLHSNRLKANLYGENELEIAAGDSRIQKYRLFGENIIDTEQVSGDQVSAYFFGENVLDLYATNTINLWGFGEVKMRYAGDPYLKRLVIGESSITIR